MRNYDKDFNLNAVNLYKSSGKSVNCLSEELGVPQSTVSRWRRHYEQYGQNSFPGKGHLREPDDQLRQLERELAYVREERVLLKKAVAIFSKPKHRGMRS